MHLLKLARDCVSCNMFSSTNDIILLDTTPRFSLLATNVFAYATHILIPCRYAMNGVHMLHHHTVINGCNAIAHLTQGNHRSQYQRMPAK